MVNGGVHRDPNAIAVQCVARFFSNACQKMRGSKHVKVKKRRRQDILHFRADPQKLILGSIGTPFDHLSVKGESVVAAILPSHMEMSYCTSRFFRS